MALVQALNDDHFKTFNDLAEIVQKRLVRVLKNTLFDTAIVTLVFDRYQEASIKAAERQRRGATDNVPTHQIIGNRNVPNYRQFLKGTGNKVDLVQFVSEYIMENSKATVPHGKSIVIAGGFQNGEEVRSISSVGLDNVEDLYSTHEEADTRMILHAISLSSLYQRIIVRCDDTDVLVLLLHYMNRGLLAKETFMHAGHSGKCVTRERFIPIHIIGDELGDMFCQSLPSAHALTGCDSTNAFFGVGKKTVFTTLQKQIESGAVDGLTDPGGPDWIEAARKLVLGLHGNKGQKCATLNELRYLLATTTDKQASQLPPTEDAFKQHSLRARYQTVIWCSSHIAKPELESPVGNGWYRDTTGLHPTMFTQESAPAEVRDLTHLYCRDGACTDGTKCTCLMAGLRCIDICECDHEACQTTIPNDADSDADADDQ